MESKSSENKKLIISKLNGLCPKSEGLKNSICSGITCYDCWKTALKEAGKLK